MPSAFERLRQFPEGNLFSEKAHLLQVNIDIDIDIAEGLKSVHRGLKYLYLINNNNNKCRPQIFIIFISYNEKNHYQYRQWFSSLIEIVMNYNGTDYSHFALLENL